MARSKRINASIESNLERLVSELARDQGVSMSAIVVKALEAFCDSAQPRKGARLFEAFKSSGLLGCIKGGKAMSLNYKGLLQDSLDKKFFGKLT
jgi:hypothetical protein